MKKIIALIMSLFCYVAVADVVPPVPPIPPSPVSSRVSIFSTTVDWAAVTGMGLKQYTGKITGNNKSLVKDGLVLYYLDAFPCYGEADSVRVWISPNDKMVGNLRLVCVHKPSVISFAWRNAKEDALDAKTTGLLTCSVEGNKELKIDLSKCEIGKEWKEYK